MQNMVYVLLVADMRADGSVRARIDDILAGKVKPPMAPEIPDAEVWGQQKPSDEQMARLRESWGATPQAGADKAAFDSGMRTMPRMR